MLARVAAYPSPPFILPTTTLANSTICLETTPGRHNFPCQHKKRNRHKRKVIGTHHHLLCNNLSIKNTHEKHQSYRAQHQHDGYGQAQNQEYD